MKSSEALQKLADITVSQWGMVTAAQAGTLKISRLTLSRLAESGHLERLAHGVYRDAGVPADEFEDLRAAWLSTAPKQLAEERLRDLTGGVVVASTSAALLHGIGDLWADRHEFVTVRRRQTQRAEIRYRQRDIAERDVAVVEGLPVMTLERTLADLLEDVGDLSLVADALGEATKKRLLDFERLRELFSPLAERNGFRRHDGNAVLERLLETAGLDLEAVARRISGDSVLGSRVVSQFLEGLMRTVELPDFEALTRVSLPNMPVISEQTARAIQEVMGSQSSAYAEVSKALAGVVSPDIGRTIAELVNSPAFRTLSEQWAKGVPALPASTIARDSESVAVDGDDEPRT